VAFRGAFRDSSSRMNESGSYRFRDRTSPSKPWRVGASSRNSAAEASALREASRNTPRERKNCSLENLAEGHRLVFNASMDCVAELRQGIDFVS